MIRLIQSPINLLFLAALTLDIIVGPGTANTFLADVFGAGAVPLDADMIDAMSQANHATVDITSDEIPHAIEIQLSHASDVSVGGTVTAFVVNHQVIEKIFSGAMTAQP